MSSILVEEQIPGGHKVSFRAHAYLFQGQSKFQRVEIADTIDYGRMLLNDGLVMCSERDEFIYHEMITQPALFTHGNARSVLVIGGGDGGTVREIVRHKSVESCLLVEIDAMVVEASLQFLPGMSSELRGNPKVEVLIEDGVRFARETKRRFDLIIVDSTDPIGPATPLFGAEFYADLKRILLPGGIIVAQAESPFFAGEMQKKLMEIQTRIFKQARIYNFSNLTYPGGLWSFTWASDTLCPLQDFKPQAITDSGLQFRYYNADVHRAGFSLPEFQRQNLREFLR